MKHRKKLIVPEKWNGNQLHANLFQIPGTSATFRKGPFTMRISMRKLPVHDVVEPVHQGRQQAELVHQLKSVPLLHTWLMMSPAL